MWHAKERKADFENHYRNHELGPWETATLRAVAHRFDATRKGYLDGVDFRRLCIAAGCAAPGEGSTLLKMLDADHDGVIVFEELLHVIGCPEPRVKEDELVKRLRAFATDSKSFMNMPEQSGWPESSRFVQWDGKIIGRWSLLLGSFFWDPIRLFRDFYVLYDAALRNHLIYLIKRKKVWKPQRRQEKLHRLRGDGIISIIKQHLSMARRPSLTMRLLMLAIIVDTAVGFLVFTAYDRVRVALRDRYPETCNTRSWVLEVASGTLVGCIPAALEEVAYLFATGRFWENFVNFRWRRFVRIQKGSVAFALSEPWIRHSVGHGVFFGAFFVAQRVYRNLLYDYYQCQRTSRRDVWMTAASGCTAGAAYRCATLPLRNLFKFANQHSHHQFFKLSLQHKLRIATRGLGVSLQWTMPMLGAAFILSEFPRPLW